MQIKPKQPITDAVWNKVIRLAKRNIAYIKKNMRSVCAANVSLVKFDSRV